MDVALLEMFRFHAWATAHLLGFCRDLTKDALGKASAGAFGTISETFQHLISSDGAYLRCLGGEPPPWQDGELELSELEARAAHQAAAWETLLTAGVDATRKLLLDKGTYEVGAAVVIAQAIHHGDLHREQICATLTTHGTEPPDLQPWAFADATARSRSLER